jgi:hypothetical protein
MSVQYQDADPTPPDVPEADHVDAVLSYHEGDARAAIATLLGDVRHLRLQLALADGVMSRGMTRGWRPRFDRD